MMGAKVFTATKAKDRDELGEVLTRTYFESQGKHAYTVRTTLNLEQSPQRRAA